MRTYLRLFVGMYLIGVAFADLSTGRFDSVNLSYGKTNVSNVGVFSNAWAWDMPVYPSQDSSMSFQLGIMRWQDNTPSDHSFVGLHAGTVLKMVLPTQSVHFLPHVDLGLGAASFGRKDFADYHLASNFKLEASALLAANFGSKEQYDIGIAYAGYFLGGGDDVHVLPRLIVGYHF